jgi:Zn-dependent metalloprotease
MLDLKNCKVRWDRDRYIPRKIYGFETEPLPGAPHEIAEKFLRDNASALKISSRFEDLRYDRVTESLGAKTVLFQQHFNGTPIHGAWVAIHINNENKIFMIKNDTVPVSRLEEQIPRSKAGLLPKGKVEALLKKKIREYGVLDTAVKKERMIYPLRGQLKRVWKVKFGTQNPAASWILFVDQATGHILEERNVLWKADGKGQVFIPNPVVALNRDDLLDQKDDDQEVFKGAYRRVTLRDLEPGGRLKGPYVDTTNTPNSARSTDLQFIYSRKDDRFEEVMAYYHIDALQRYVRSLGFSDNKEILNRSIKVNAHGGKEDNSYYNPSPGKQDITYGDGGVDDAEDADVIVHEYGHAIQDAVLPGFGQGKEGRAMGEGFGDYLAGTFHSSYKKGDRKYRVAEWDAKGYEGGPQECLRRLDSKKHYPEDMEGEEHADGEIWSACLWKIRKALGKIKSDTVILESHFYLNQYSDFKDGAEAILMAEKNVYGAKKQKALQKIFRESGILQ